MLVWLLALLLVSLVLHRLRWRKSAFTLLTFTVAVLLGVACGPLTSLLLRGLQSPYAMEPKVAWTQDNVIVMLGAGTVKPEVDALHTGFFAQGRVLRAAELYADCRRAGKHCRLLVSGGDAQKHGEAEATVYGRAFRALGVPSGDLLLEDRSMTTWQNAQFSRALLVKSAAQHAQLVLVTSAVHLQRSLLFFAHFGMVAQPVAGDWLAPETGWLPLAWNMAAADAALHEYIGIVRYHAYNLLGMNAPKAPALGD